LKSREANEHQRINLLSAEKARKQMNNGALFKNFYKKDNSKSPDYQGECNIDGVKYKIGGWIMEYQKRDKEGKQHKYISLSFKKRKPEEQNTPDQYRELKEQLKDEIGWTK